MTVASRGEGPVDPESRPLEGRRVVVTRPRPQIDALSGPLAALGAEVIEAPSISIHPPDDPAPLEEALSGISGFDWVVFTSANGVEAVARRLEESAGMASLAGTRVAAVGPGTRLALESLGVTVHLMPAAYRVEDLADALVADGKASGVRFLLPRAEQASPVLPEVLRREGGIVTDVSAYRTVPEAEGADRTREALLEGKIHYVTFSSASTCRGFVAKVGIEAVRVGSPPARFASIGPETSRAATDEGIEIHLEADPHTIPGLISAIARDSAQWPT